MQIIAGCARKLSLLATVSLCPLLIGAVPALAQNATWIGSGGPPDTWNTAANWSPAAVPTATAFFNSSLTTTTSIDMTGAPSISGMTFNSAPAYTFALPGFFGMSGAGVVVDSGSAAPTFQINTGGTLALANSATLGPSIVNIALGGDLSLQGSSTAGTAQITNSNTIHLEGTSSAGSSTITNNSGGQILFNLAAGSATAGNSTIGNSGNIVFLNTATAGNAAITTLTGGQTSFQGDSTAGTSLQTVATGGVLFFNGNASAGNSTIINSSNNPGVQFQGNSTAGSANITNNAGATILFQGTGVSAGNSTIRNSGTLVFTTTSTAANATIITETGGSTQFNNAALGGNASFVVNASGGTAGVVSINTASGSSFTMGSLAGTSSGGQLGQVQIGGKTLSIGGNNQSTTFDGVIFNAAGGGSLIKTGTGTLTLSGQVSLLGGGSAVTVLGGTLNVTGTMTAQGGVTVGPGATLSGLFNGGFVNANVIVNGTIAANVSGGTPFVISGNLDMGTSGILRTNFVNGVGGNIAVTGGSTTLGGTLQLRPDAAGVTFGLLYTITTNSSAPISQQFTSVDAPIALRTLVFYNPGNVQVAFSPNVTGAVAGGASNQQAIAAALDKGLQGGAGAFSPLFSITDPAVLRTVLSQLSGEVATGGATSGIGAMSQFMNALLNPFVESRAGGFSAGPSLGFAPEAEAADATMGYVQRQKVSEDATQAFAQLRRPAARDSSFNVWSTGYGSWGRSSGDVNVGSNTMTTRTGGMVVGVDYRPSFDAVFGVALGGARTSYGLDPNLGGGESDIAQLGVYGTIRQYSAYVSAAFAYGWHSVSTSRTVAMLSSDPITGKYDGQSLNGRLEAGTRVGPRQWGFTPFVAMQFQRLSTPDYTESATGGGAPFTLSYAATSTASMRSELGVWFNAEPVHDVKLRARVAWAHEFADAPAATASFTTIATGPFTITGTRPGVNAVLLSAATEWTVTRQVSLIARFDGELSESSKSYAGTGGIRYTW